MHTIKTDILRRQTTEITALKSVVSILGASIFIAMLAKLSLPLPFTPVPVTLQTLGVYLVAAALGPRKAFLAVLTYLAQGFAGLPVFAQGTLPGIAALLGPTGGYLIGFLPAAALG
ncbi:MAG TPA: biotin transporter BioY, partial [Elusimicrobiales bacterium]|nr:biotin transporter BioY [Elusimicrobiales bacterium]